MRNTKQVEEPFLDNKSNQNTVSDIFKIQLQDLQALFDQRFDFERCIIKLNELGGIKSILKRLATYEDAGIKGDNTDLLLRKNKFGPNDPPLAIPASIFSSIKQEASNILWFIVAATALFAGLCGWFVNGWRSMIEGISIVCIMAVIIIFSAACDYIKDAQFLFLQTKTKNEDVTVIRGKYHATQSVSVWKLVVGDIVLLDTGMRVPADCLIISSEEMAVDESPEDEEIQQKQKSEFTGRTGDPFLKADSLIIRGKARAVVCAVGENSSRGKFIKNLQDEINDNTSLQVKLKNLGNQFSKWAILSSALILIILITITVIETIYGDDDKLADGTVNPEKKNAADIIFSKIPKHINLAVVLIIVSIPEALPLTVGISLAHSVSSMIAGGILIRKLDAPERLAAADEICVGKTGTLTENKMKVGYFYLEGQQFENQRNNSFMMQKNVNIDPETIQLVNDSIIYNTSALVEMENTRYHPKGNGTEVCLLKWLQKNQIPIQLQTEDKLQYIRASLPFSSDNKFSAVAVEHPNRPGNVALYIKGAPEIILAMCPHALVQNKSIVQIDEVQENNGMQISYKDDFQQKIHILAGQPHRVIAMAYAELNEQEWSSKEQQFPTPSQCLTDLIQTNRIQFTMIGAIALRDKIRKGAKESVDFARDEANLSVRLISGDHIETATAVAKQVGIIKEEERGGTYTVMDAGEFENMIGGFDRNEQIANQQAFNEIMQDLRVLARAKPEHKHMVTVGLKDFGKSVVVVGDGINDVKSIQIADVGMAMGSGCSAAKEVSDIILMKDDFSASVQAIMWGRNIYHNIGRFLQFQVTVNLSLLLTVAIGSPILAESPFSAVQLLWINLIMDTLACLALATEKPLASVLNGPPFKDDTNLLTPAIWRQILGVTFWNVSVMLIVILIGPSILGLDYVYTTSANDSDESGQNKLRHLTIIFNVFVFLQIYNLTNCRKIGRRDFNILEGIHQQFYFILVQASMVFVQVVMIQWVPGLTRTTSLTRSDWGGTLVIGITTWAIAILLKLTPEKWLEKVKVDKLINENRVSSNDGILKAYNSAKKIKVQDLQKNKKQDQDAEDNDFKNIK